MVATATRREGSLNRAAMKGGVCEAGGCYIALYSVLESEGERDMIYAANTNIPNTCN